MSWKDAGRAVSRMLPLLDGWVLKACNNWTMSFCGLLNRTESGNDKLCNQTLVIHVIHTRPASDTQRPGATTEIVPFRQR